MDFTTRFKLHSQATRLVALQNTSAHNLHTDDSPASNKSTGLTPSVALRTEKEFVRRETGGGIGRATDYNSFARTKDSHPELIPLHSPLLRESLLVSFPPLSNMLKSSGSSCLIRGLGMRERVRKGKKKKESFGCCVFLVAKGCQRL